MTDQINPHLKSMESDYLYHFGMGTSDDLPSKFGDVRYLVMGGSSSRMELFSQLLQIRLGFPLTKPVDLAVKGGRYSLFKTGPVLAVNHNIGASTLSVVLHETFKLLHHAGLTKDQVHVIRLGTSGGVGVEGGTVVIADGALDALKRRQFHTAACGKEIKIDMGLDQPAAKALKSLADEMNIQAAIGSTMGTDDFYLGQGRLDGYFCDYTMADKMEFLKDLHDNYNVRNIEMEAHILSSFCNRAGFKCSDICVALLNRLNGDQVLTPKETMKKWERFPLKLVTEFIGRAVDAKK